MDYGATSREALAHAMVEDIGRPVAYRSVERGGAPRAAAMISELIA